jgi:hypothetical protein
MSKTRSDSWLRNLPAERQEQIIEWCNAPADREPETDKAVPKTGGYHYARAQLAADGLSASVSTLSDFYSWWHLRQKFQRAEQKTSDFEEFARREFPDVAPERIQLAGQNYFTLRAVASDNSEEFREMEKLRLAKETAETKGRQKDEELKLAERRVRVMESKISKAEETLKDGSLNPTQREQRMKEIFGITT